VVFARGLDPVPGSVVVADLPGHGLIVKRVTASAGEVPEGWGSAPLPPGTCFLVGDNRENSYDSRTFGPLPVERIVGRVVLVWPRRASSGVEPEPGTCFLVGDNRENSYDSRAFGPLPVERIVGRVVLVWPRRASSGVEPEPVFLPARP